MNNYSPVQSDLFDTAFGTSSVSANVKPSAPSSGAPTLFQYAQKVALRIWPKDKTRHDNLRACQWFSEFSFTDDRGEFCDCGKLTLDEVKRKHIYAFVEHLMETRKRFGQNTANKYMAAISAVMREANEKSVCDNPIKLRYTTIKNARPAYLTRDKEAELCQHLTDHGHAWIADMVILACNTGMRKNEILSITHREVEREGDWLYLPEVITKTGEARYVPLNDKAAAAYERLLPVVDKVWSHRTFYWFWNKAKRDVFQNDPNFVFHITRHTAATRLANDVSMSEFNVADIMGHADTRTTRRYVKSKKAALLAGVQAL